MLASPSRHPGPTGLVRLARAVGIGWLLLAAAGAAVTVRADPFLDDFEGEREYTRYPVKSLRNWTIIDSVDLTIERSSPPLCRHTGTCIDLVGTSGATTGGLLSKTSLPAGTYLIGFQLYGSGRTATGDAAAADGVATRIQVSFGARSIYANNAIPSDFSDFVLLRVYGSGKLRFEAGSDAADVGPLLDNVLALRLGPVGP